MSSVGEAVRDAGKVASATEESSVADGGRKEAERPMGPMRNRKIIPLTPAEREDLKSYLFPGGCLF